MSATATYRAAQELVNRLHARKGAGEAEDTRQCRRANQSDPIARRECRVGAPAEPRAATCPCTSSCQQKIGGRRKGTHNKHEPDGEVSEKMTSPGPMPRNPLESDRETAASAASESATESRRGSPIPITHDLCSEVAGLVTLEYVD
jgi:hypothetical protein